MRTKTTEISTGQTVVAIDLTALQYAALMDRIDQIQREGNKQVDQMQMYLDVCAEFVTDPSRSAEEWNERPVDELAELAGFVLTPKKTNDQGTGTVGDS